MKIKKGFTLVEIMVVIGILALVFVGVYSGFQLIVRILQGAKLRTIAVSVATEKLELVRNLPYDEVGVVSGIPSGVLSSEEDLSRNSFSFTVSTDVRYIDDVFDDVAPTDTLNTDYKQVRIEVSWVGYDSENPVIMFGNVSPPGVETTLGGGTLKIEVFDTDPDPVSQAQVRVVNSQISPQVDIVLPTNDNGVLLLPGVVPYTEGYEIYVSKSGYTTAQTYSEDIISNPDPSPPHLSVEEGFVSYKAFTIDRLSSIAFETKDQDDAALGDVDLHLSGERHIGLDSEGLPILIYDEDILIPESGSSLIPDMAFDTYTLTAPASSGYVITSSTSQLPFILSPDEDLTLVLKLAPYESYTSLVNVIDNDNNPISGAEVQVVKTPYDATVNTDSSGYSFFAGLEPGDFSLTVTAAGYVSYTDTITIDGNNDFSIIMTDS